MILKNLETKTIFSVTELNKPKYIKFIYITGVTTSHERNIDYINCSFVFELSI